METTTTLEGFVIDLNAATTAIKQLNGLLDSLTAEENLTPGLVYTLSIAINRLLTLEGVLDKETDRIIEAIVS